MQVSSGEAFTVCHFAHKLYLVMASAIFLGTIAESVLIGPSLFAAASFGRAIHGATPSPENRLKDGTSFH